MTNLLNEQKINVCIQGLGYVGSSLGVALGSAKNNNKLPIFNVIGVEKDTQNGKKIIDNINNGKFPFNTRDKLLIKKFKETYKIGNFKATSSHSAFSKADVVLVTVNCDIKKKGELLKINLNSFKYCISEFSKKIKESTLVIIESTIPPGTCEKIVLPVIKKNFHKRKLDPNKIFLAHAYERVMPGKNYLNSIINNWRVFSGINKKSSELCENFLTKFINTKKFPLTRLDNTKSSELSKLMENSFRAVNIAFIEEWSRFAEDIGIDIYKVIGAIKQRPTHQNIQNPGFGVGGYCLTKDPLMAELCSRTLWKKRNKFLFSNKAVEINNAMPLVSVNKILEFFNNKISGKKFLLLGASYKEDVDDTRNSPSKILYSKLLSLKAKVEVHDPLVSFWKEANINPEKKIPSLKKYDCVIFAVKHQDYNKINLNKWKPAKKNFLFFDANNVLSSNQIKIINKSKLNIISIGRGNE